MFALHTLSLPPPPLQEVCAGMAVLRRAILEDTTVSDDAPLPSRCPAGFPADIFIKFKDAVAKAAKLALVRAGAGENVEGAGEMDEELDGQSGAEGRE